MFVKLRNYKNGRLKQLKNVSLFDVVDAITCISLQQTVVDSKINWCFKSHLKCLQVHSSLLHLDEE